MIDERWPELAPAERQARRSRSCSRSVAIQWSSVQSAAWWSGYPSVRLIFHRKAHETRRAAAFASTPNATIWCGESLEWKLSDAEKCIG